MRVLASALVASLILLAGCSDGPARDDGTGSDDQGVEGRPVWFHDGMGNVLDASAFAGEAPEFEQIRVTTRISGEPTVGVTRTGAVFYAAIDFDVGAGATTLPRTLYMRSVDGGATWEDASPNLANVPTHPTSFDPYVYADPTTGRVYAMDMGPHVACNKVSWSDDDGRTWTTREGACPLPVADHPTLFAGPRVGVPELPAGDLYPNALYLCSNQVADTQCSMSPDGGMTWLPSQPVYTGVDPEGDGGPGICSGLTGHGHAAPADGTVYVPRLWCGVPQVGISRDGGLTYEVVTVAEGPQYAPQGGVHESAVATDAEGTVYYFWIGGGGSAAYLSVSHDQGRTWGAPWNVTAPGVTAMKLPSLVAGAAGRVAFQYVGTTTPSGHDVGMRGEDGARLHEAEWRNATWNAYVGVGLDAAGEAPVFATTTVNDVAHPLKRGDCAGRCFGDVGGMYDFLDLEIDPMTGRLWSALVDVCTGECDEADADADTFERAFGAVGKQVGGTRLLDEPVPAAQ